METIPSPSEIRALRGTRSRDEFAALIDVTPLTVYRWELPPDSPELRHPRGKVLKRLQAWIAQESARPPVANPMAPLTLEPTELEALLPSLSAIDRGELDRAEADLVSLLSSDALRGSASRALATVALAKLQLLVRHDTRAAFTTLLGLGSDVSRFPREVQLQFHVVSAFLHAHADARLFNPGKTNHHAALAEPLFGDSDGEHRFFLWYAQFIAAASIFETALMARLMERFAAVRELAPSPLGKCLAREALVISSLSLTNLAEAARRADEFLAASADVSLPVQKLRALVWRAEISLEEGTPPAQILETIEQAETLQRHHRIASGVHGMLLHRNKGEVLLRLCRLGEAEAAFLEAARVGGEIGYTPFRPFAALARLFSYGRRVEDSREIAGSLLKSEGHHRDLSRFLGQVMLLLCDVADGNAAAGWFERMREHLDEIRKVGAWAVAYRYIVTHALSICVESAGIDEAGKMLAIAERALMLSPSLTASALLRRCQGLLLARRGRYGEARQALEAARATFEVSGNRPEAALARRALATIALLQGEPDAARQMAETAAELEREGIGLPPAIRTDEAPSHPVPAASRPRAPILGIDRLVVPFQRLTARGVGASILQKELMNVVAEVLPDRPLRLEEVDSAGISTGLGDRNGAADLQFEWFDFGDGAGRRMRLGVRGRLDETERAALVLLVSGAALAFEVAALRGFTEPARKRPEGMRALPASDEARLTGFVAASTAMLRLKSEIGRLSGSRATIIVTGESGTGKEVVARAIHDLSQRAGRPYVTFNSAAVPRELFEGQLFGYRKGAFTGAATDHPGVIRAADRGTLFLDEIGELPLDVQPKLLRFLENGEILPLGERKSIQVDVRVITATHRDLLQLVREGKFREDLYYRLQVIPVHIPPLRERREDVVALARFFIRKLTPAGMDPPTLGLDGEAKLRAHSWPGNVRELRNVIERSLAFDPLPLVLTADHVRL